MNELVRELNDAQLTADIALHLWKEYTLAGLDAHAKAAWHEHEDANAAVNWVVSKMIGDKI